MTHRRAHYRRGASLTTFVPVSENQGLINGRLTRPVARLGLMKIGNYTLHGVKSGAICQFLTSLIKKTI